MSPLKLIPSLILVLTLSVPALGWVWGQWLESPADRQGLIWALAGAVLYARGWGQRGVREMDIAYVVAVWLLMLGALAAVFGIVSHFDFAHAMGAVIMVTGLAVAMGLPLRPVLAASGLLVLSLPGTSGFLGGVIAGWGGLDSDQALAIAVVSKWPVAAAILLLWLGRGMPALVTLALALPLAWGFSVVSAAWPVPDGLAPVGTAPWASLGAALVCTVGLAVIAARKGFQSS
ncbi:MAG: hypothetical protein ACPGU7_07435 [Gammaproteobacteria bacterium]